MTTIIENKIINLNSNNATQRNGTFLSNVYFDFVGLLKEDNDITNVSISIQNAEFPYSFYNINVYNNVLVLSDDGDPPVTLTFTRGNYNANTLITEIQNQLINAGINHISITISSITGLLTFTCQNNHTLTFFANGSTCFRVLGFDPSLDYNSVASVIVAPYPLNLLGTLKLRIASYNLPINTLDSSVGGNLNVLASMPINAGNFGLIMYENTNNIQYSLNTRVLDGFDLEIIDDDGNLINFNNTYWTITMLLTIERRVYTAPTKETFSDIVKKTIQDEEPQTEEVERSEEIQQTLEEGEAVDIPAPDLEDIIPNDLELLLYSSGIR